MIRSENFVDRLSHVLPSQNGSFTDEERFSTRVDGPRKSTKILSMFDSFFLCFFKVLIQQENVLGNQNIVIESNNNTNNIVQQFEIESKQRKSSTSIFFIFIAICFFINGISIIFSTKNYIGIDHLKSFYRNEINENQQRYKNWKNYSISSLRRFRFDVKQFEKQIFCSNSTEFQSNATTLPFDRLNRPSDLFIDDDETFYIADSKNNRIVVKKFDGKTLEIRSNRFENPTNLVVDKETNSIFICFKNDRIVERRFIDDFDRNEIFLDRINCNGLTTDNEGFLYVSVDDEVRRYAIDEPKLFNIVVDQLDSPTFLVVDSKSNLFVSDTKNDRIMKSMKNYRQNQIFIEKNHENRLTSPKGLSIDFCDRIYVVDSKNSRILRFENEKFVVVAGGKGKGDEVFQLNDPSAIFFDRFGRIHVVDSGNNRIQRFSLRKRKELVDK